MQLNIEQNVPTQKSGSLYERVASSLQTECKSERYFLFLVFFIVIGGWKITFPLISIWPRQCIALFECHTVSWDSDLIYLTASALKQPLN